MTDQTENKIEADVYDELAAVAAAAETAPAEPPAETAEARAARLEGEVADLKDKLLRALAEAENVRRRAERQRVETSRYAIANFAREMVVVADNLRRALDSVDAAARQADDKLETLCTGVEMTERAMMNAFERVDIRRVEALGQRFDHNVHEAMFEAEDLSKPAGTVIHVMETGYLIGDRLLRPAKVGVARGGPKPAVAPAPAADTAEAGARASHAYESTGAEAGGKLDERS